MSVDEDTELRDMVIEQLDANGVLGKLKAMLRAHVFLTLEHPENVKKPNNDLLRKSLATNEGRLMAALVLEYLHFFNLEFTVMTFKPEAGLDDSASLARDELSRQLDIVESEQSPAHPLLCELIKRLGDSSSSDEKSRGRRSTEHADLTQKHIDDAKKKFDQYDQDSSGTIEKGELRMLFADMFPDVNKSMLDRYVNDQYSYADRDFSGGIDFNEFLNLYRSFFVLSKSVVSHDVSDILLSPKQLSPMSKIPIKMPDVKKTVDKPADSPKQDLSGNGSKHGSAGDNWWDTKRSQDRVTDPVKAADSSSKPNAVTEASQENKENIFVDDKSRTKEISKIPVFGNGQGISGDKARVSTNGGKLTVAPIPAAAAAAATPLSPTTAAPLSPQLVSAAPFTTAAALSPEPAAAAAAAPAPPAATNQKPSMSSLADLPALGAASRAAAKPSGALPPPLQAGVPVKSDVLGSSSANTKDPSKDLKAIDKRLAELGFGEDDDYEEDFQSSANPSESTSTEKVEEEEEIEEEIVPDVDDILNTGRSLDNTTTDRTVTPVHDMDGADYWEEAELIK